MKFDLSAGRLALLSCSLLIGGALPSALAQDARPDNTKVNKRDRSEGAPTAGQQSNAKSDQELTRQIRRSIVKDKSLSTYAHNVKIITRDGAVTLRGPVRSEQEKDTIAKIAGDAAGSGKVTNELEIAPAKGGKSHSKDSSAAGDNK